MTRATRWGNPYPVGTLDRDESLRLYRAGLLGGSLPGVGRFAPVTVVDVRRHLASYDLACACPLDLTCHADLLLAVANGVTE